jgi:hypothetical protein
MIIKFFLLVISILLVPVQVLLNVAFQVSVQTAFQSAFQVAVTVNYSVTVFIILNNYWLILSMVKFCLQYYNFIEY